MSAPERLGAGKECNQISILGNTLAAALRMDF